MNIQTKFELTLEGEDVRSLANALRYHLQNSSDSDSSRDKVESRELAKRILARLVIKDATQWD